MKNILCLDLGTKTGWAFYPGGREMIIKIYGEDIDPRLIEPSWGVEDFSTKRFEGGGMRYLNFKRWLDRLLLPEEIYFEEVHHNGLGKSAEVYGGFLGVLMSWCEKEKIPYQGVHVGTIKKYITGKGNASKQMVIDAVRQVGHAVEDDNEADAMALMLYIMDREKRCDNV